MLNNQMVIRLMMGIGIKPVHGQLNWELALKLISNITKWRCRYRSDMVCFFWWYLLRNWKWRIWYWEKPIACAYLCPFLHHVCPIYGHLNGEAMIIRFWGPSFSDQPVPKIIWMVRGRDCFLCSKDECGWFFFAGVHGGAWEDVECWIVWHVTCVVCVMGIVH